LILRPVLRPVLRSVLRSPLVRGGGPGFDADARAWAAAVTAAGGTYSTTTLAAISAFCVSAKANGYWSKLTRINLLCGNNLTAARVPLKAGGGASIDTNVSFVSGDYSESTGLTGNGATKHLRTGLTPNGTLTLNDTHLAVYNRAPNATGGQIGIGVDDAVSFFQTYSPLSTGSFFSDQYNSSGAAGRISGAVTAPYRLLVASRTASNSHVIYQDGASVASSATSGGGLPNLPFYVFATNGNGVAGQFTAMPLAAYSIGAGLTAGEVASFSADMQTFQTALGRNV
jgi:hypothetical protein